MSRLAKAAMMGAAGAAGDKLYVEDVFSTYLYDGTGSNQTVTNGIDLAGEGGLIWTKWRSGGVYTTESHALLDTERGFTKVLRSDTTGAQSNVASYFTANSDGYDITTGSSLVNHSSGGKYASWTFRKAPGFFDVVTYAGNSTARSIPHNLGSTPGCIIVRSYDNANNWYVLHRGLNTVGNEFIQLNSTNGKQDTGSDEWNSTAPTSTHFSVGTDGNVNLTGRNYIAYLFAHDAGGFGDDGTENVISCGSFTANPDGTFPTVNLGWEPQWLLVKRSDGASPWFMFDNMRGIATGGTDAILYANYNDAETQGDYVNLTATGFTGGSSNPVAANAACIYIAIRRGPMKTPEDATEVFQTLLYTGSASAITRSTSITVDALFTQRRNVGTPYALDRMRGGTRYLSTQGTGAEDVQSDAITEFGNDYLKMGAGSIVNESAKNYCLSMFRRAPGFFDVVAYTGTGSATTVSHNLGVAPELMIIKQRNSANQWAVGSEGLTDWTKYMQLSSDAGESTFAAIFNSTAPTATVFSVGTAGVSNGSSNTYIAYLFATLPGISKVGSYTGTGTTLDVNCGFSAGARYVLIKRTDTQITGQTYNTDWYVWDTARGIGSGNDPYLLLNSFVAENTSTDFIDPLSTGFQITSSAPAAINANGGSYIFLAIA